MSSNSIDDRNRFLESQGYTIADLQHKGVTESDSTEVALHKLGAGGSTSAGGGVGYGGPGGYSGGGGYDASVGAGLGGGPATSIDTGSFILLLKILGIGLALYFVSAIGWAAWSAKDELLAHWREAHKAEISEKRIQDYSDFSALPDWPQDVQALYKQQENTALGTLLDEIPENINKLSPERRRALGAQIWFKISNKGAGAGEVLAAVQKAPHRVGLPVARSTTLSLQFLDAECKKGVELACLDAAKSLASAVWYGKGSAREGWTIQSALDHLPSSGPLAHSKGIESLRAKLLATRESIRH